MVSYYLGFILIFVVLLIIYNILWCKVEKRVSREGKNSVKRVLFSLVLVSYIVLSFSILSGCIYYYNSKIYEKVASTIESSYRGVNNLECNIFNLTGSFESQGIKYRYKFNPKDYSLSISISNNEKKLNLD